MASAPGLNPLQAAAKRQARWYLIGMVCLCLTWAWLIETIATRLIKDELLATQGQTATAHLNQVVVGHDTRGGYNYHLYYQFNTAAGATKGDGFVPYASEQAAYRQGTIAVRYLPSRPSYNEPTPVLDNLGWGVFALGVALISFLATIWLMVKARAAKKKPTPLY